MAKYKRSAAAILAVPLLLGGCSNDGYGMAALDAPAGPADVAPDGVDLPFLSEMDEGSLRFLAEDNGRQYFGARAADGGQACVVVVFPRGAQSSAHAGCGAVTGSGNRIITVSGPDGKPTALVRDNADHERLESEGFRHIHRNVYVAG